MDKDIRKFLEESLETLKELMKESKNEICGIASKHIDRAIDEPVEISIKKKQGGKATSNIKGTKLGLLVTLAGLESNILKTTDTTQEQFENIKKLVGTKEVEIREVKDNE